MAKRKHQDASKASPWEKLPLEVAGFVLKSLDSSDLKSCRLLSKSIAEEATRHLFSTIQLGPDIESYKHATSLIKYPSFAKHIRHLVYKSSEICDPQNIRYLVKSMKFRQLSSISLTELGYAEAVYLFSMDEQREGVLANVNRLVLTFNNFGPAAHSFLKHLRREMSQVSRNLLTRLPQVHNIELGFSTRSSRYDCFADWKVTKSGTEYLLSLNFAQLTTLTLENVFTTEDALLGFVVRHRKTLRSLTLRKINLDVTEEYPRYLPGSQGLKNIMRLMIGLNRNAFLDHVSLQRAIDVCALHDRRANNGYDIVLGQNGEALDDGSPATGSLRQKLEDFICHRADFPFHFLRPYIDDLAEGKLESESNRFILKYGDDGARLEIFPEVDDTFVLEDYS